MNLSDINPYIRLATRSLISAPYRINQRIILDYELLYIDNGEFILNYSGHDFTCKKGDVLLICPNIPHSFHIFKTDLSQPHIHFDMKYDSVSEKVFISFQDYPSLSKEERLMIRKNIFPQPDGSPYIKLSDKDTFLNIFFSIIDTKDKQTLSCKAKMLNLLHMIVTENISTSFSSPSASSTIASLVKSYIDSNYEQEISLDTLERQFDYSKFYIEKLFKQEYGLSVINYRNTKRMETAVQLLENHSVSETALLLGFSSIYSFSRAFRTKYGTSPTKYISVKENKNR